MGFRIVTSSQLPLDARHLHNGLHRRRYLHTYVVSYSCVLFDGTFAEGIFLARMPRRSSIVYLVICTIWIREIDKVVDSRALQLGVCTVTSYFATGVEGHGQADPVSASVTTCH